MKRLKFMWRYYRWLRGLSRRPFGRWAAFRKVMQMQLPSAWSLQERIHHLDEASE